VDCLKGLPTAPGDVGNDVPITVINRAWDWSQVCVLLMRGAYRANSHGRIAPPDRIGN